jgi:hypothetical protein
MSFKTSIDASGQLTGLAGKAIPTLYVDDVVDLTTAEPVIVATGTVVLHNGAAGNTSNTAQAVLTNRIYKWDGLNWIAQDKYNANGNIVTDVITGVSYRKGPLTPDAAWTQITAEVLSTIIDASTAAYAETLPAATGSGAIKYWVLQDKTNAATLAVQTGEAINGATDGSFDFAVYEVGTQFQATDRGTGNWDIAVVGESTGTNLVYAKFGYDFTSSPVDTTGTDHQILESVASSGTTYSDPLTAIDLANGTFTAPRAMKIRVDIHSGFMNNTTTGDNNVIYHRNLAYSINGGAVIRGASAVQNPEMITAVNDFVHNSGTMVIDLAAGDVVRFYVSQFNTGGFVQTYTYHDLMIQELPSQEVVLAGMLTVEDLQETIFAEQTGLTGNATYSLDNAVTWDTIKSTYESIRIYTQKDVTSVGLVEESFDIPVNKILENSRIRAEYGAAFFNLIINATTTGDFEINGFSSINNYGISIVGIKPQKTIIPTTDLVVTNPTETNTSYVLAPSGTANQATFVPAPSSIVEFGSGGTSSGSGSVTFATAQPDTNYRLFVQSIGGGNGQLVNVTGKTTTGFTVFGVDVNGTARSLSFDWMIIR